MRYRRCVVRWAMALGALLLLAGCDPPTMEDDLRHQGGKPVLRGALALPILPGGQSFWEVPSSDSRRLWDKPGALNPYILREFTYKVRRTDPKAILAFYRAALSKEGWHTHEASYRGAVLPDGRRTIPSCFGVFYRTVDGLTSEVHLSAGGGDASETWVVLTRFTAKRIRLATGPPGPSPTVARTGRTR